MFVPMKVYYSKANQIIDMLDVREPLMLVFKICLAVAFYHRWPDGYITSLHLQLMGHNVC